MRKLTAGLFYSLDGVVESPNLWQFDYFDDELGRGMGEFMARTDTVVLGRVSYEEWAGYWPNAGAEDPFAQFINPVRKYVASRTLTGPLEWSNSSLMDAGLEEFVGSLKATEGGEIAVCGSISLVRQLLFAGLLDALTLMIHPVVASSGRHLFEATDPVTKLTLLDSERTSKGNMIVTYGRREELA